MDYLNSSYREPLFSLFIIFVMIIISLFVKYIFSAVKYKIIKEKIRKISNDFNYMGDNIGYINNIKNNEITISSYKEIVENAISSGNYEYGIEIINSIMINTDQKEEMIEFLLLLSKIYLRLGSFGKCEQILLTFLSINPGNIKALEYLFISYIKTMQYEKAYDVYESLFEIGIDCDEKKLFLDLHTGKIKKQSFASSIDRINNIKNNTRLKRALYKYILSLDENYILNDILGIRDIINKQIDFQYYCFNCDKQYPIDSEICPNCFDVYSILLKEEDVTK